MKSFYKILATAVLLFTATNLFARGGGVKWHSFNEGLTKAKAENKFILVDFYTDWCGWCKKMDAETYTNSEVVNYLNTHFVLVKLNPEKDGNVSYLGKNYPVAQFAQSAGVSGYPATGFFESAGDFIGIQPGYIPADGFIKLLKYIVAKEYEKQKL